MKIRVRRNEMLRVINYYNECLAQKFGAVLLSEAQRELARREFEQLVLNTRKTQRTMIWEVPLTLKFNDDNRTYMVDIEDEQKILIID